MTTTITGMRARLAEIDDRIPLCRSELLTLADGDMDEEATQRFDALETEFHTLTAEREPIATRLAAVDNVIETARSAALADEEAPEGDTRQRAAGLESGGRSTRGRVARLDPFADLAQVRSNTNVADLRARALTAVEQERTEAFTDGQRSQVTHLLERNDKHGRIARHVLMTGSADYARAFSRSLEGLAPHELEPEELYALNQATQFQRASMAEGADGTGGFLVPFFVDPTIMLQNAGSTNPFRQIARVESVTGPKWRGITTAGITTSWLAEGTEIASESNPVFAQPEIDIFKAGAYLTASWEVTQDTDIVNSLGMLLTDAKDQFEAAAFVSGTGSSQPEGVIHAVSADSGSVVSDSTSGSAAYAVGDVYAQAAALPPRYRANASWVMNNSIQLLTRQFASGTGPQHAFWADLGMNTPSQLLGRPLYESSAMDDTVADGKFISILGDFRQYLIADRVGMTIQYNPMVLGSSRRPTDQVGWFAKWRVGAGCLNTDAFRVLKIAAA